jgi:hypothetical protein
MKKIFFMVFCSLIFVSNNGFVQEKVPVCQIGSNLAVDLNRELAPGEEITTETGGVVVISQKETVGSTHMVFRRCVLPEKTEVVIGGTEPWVKKCGNALIQTEGWSLPLAASQKISGPRGFSGLPGKNGIDGKDGKNGRDGRDGKNGKDGIDGANGKDGKDGKDFITKSPKKRWWDRKLFKIPATMVTVGAVSYGIDKWVEKKKNSPPPLPTPPPIPAPAPTPPQIIIIRTNP